MSSIRDWSWGVIAAVATACGGGGVGGSGAAAPDARAQPDVAVPEPDARPTWDAHDAPPAAAPDATPPAPDARPLRPDAAPPEPDAGGNVDAPDSCPDEVDLIAESDRQGASGDAHWNYTGSSRHTESANFGTCGGNGREVALLFTAPEYGLYTFTTVDPDAPPAFDSVLYARDDCTDPLTEVACDNNPDGVGATLRLQLTGGERVHLMVDAFGPFTGGAFHLDAQLQRPAGEGEACDPAGGPNACGQDLRCLSVDDRAVCRPVVAPTVTGGTLAISPGVNGVGVRVEGDDRGEDVVSLLVDAAAADGTEVPLGLGRGPYPLAFDTLQQADGRFEGTLQRFLPPDFSAGLPPIAQVTVWAVDALGLQSEPFVVDASAPVVRAPGEACDPRHIFDACADGVVCDEGMCVAPDAACPPAFGARPLAVGLAVGGDLRAAADVGAGQCGGVGGDAVYTFTADAAGTYAFSAWGDLASAAPVLYVRAACGVEDAAAELGCALPDAEGQAGLTLTLAAGQTVALFVDSAVAAWRGPFHLRAWRPAAPVLDEAQVFGNPDRHVLGFQLLGSDAENDLAGFSVRLFDADGADLLGLDAAVELALTDDEIARPAPGTLGVRAVRLLDLDTRTVARVELALVDAQGARSNVLTVVPEQTPVAARGDACDLQFAFAACAPGDRCGGVAGVGPDPQGTCQEIVDDCPPEYGEVVELSAPAHQDAGGNWHFDGDTTGRMDHTFGTCGGANSGEVAHRFEAPVAAHYVFSTVVINPRDTIVYLRSLCGGADPPSELACNDDDPAGGTFGSRVEADLNAGDVVYVFVDGFNGNDGAYTLWAEVQP